MIAFPFRWGCLAAALAVWGCALPGWRPDPAREAGARSDSLIRFRELIASGNFLGAVNRLREPERARLLDASGNVEEDAKARLRALSVRDLAGSPGIRLRKGLLSGVVREMARAGVPEGCSEEDFEPTGEADPSRAFAREQTRAAALLFFEDIRSGVWQFPLNDMHPATRSLFVDRDGRLPEIQRARLRAIDTTRWRCLALIDGKLVGVHSLLPRPPRELETGFHAFLGLIRGGEWAAAMDMLREDDKRVLTHPMGRINPAYMNRLLGLKREEWDRFSWEAGKLYGFADWLGAEANPAR